MKTRMVLFDIDGVLAKFTTGACYLHGRPTDETGIWSTWDYQRSWGIDDAEFYKGMGRAFWAGLETWHDGMYLLGQAIRLLSPSRIAFLSSPVRTEGCDQGKRDWFTKHITPLGFDAYRDLFLGGAKFKLASPGMLLIDDSDDNIRRWCQAGGAGFLVPRPWNALKTRVRSGDGSFNAGDEALALFNSLRGY